MAYQKILAIKPGKRLIGIAYMENGKLLYHGVKAIASKRNPDRIREMRRIILRLIKDLKPRTLAIEKIYFPNDRGSGRLNGHAGEIKAIGKRKKIQVVRYAPSTVKKFLCGKGHAGKKEIARVIAAKYPELRVYLNSNRLWKERWHQYVFDAAAIGLMAIEDKR